jgi:hypothetical protein
MQHTYHRNISTNDSITRTLYNQLTTIATPTTATTNIFPANPFVIHTHALALSISRPHALLYLSLALSQAYLSNHHYEPQKLNAQKLNALSNQLVLYRLTINTKPSFLSLSIQLVLHEPYCT